MATTSGEHAISAEPAVNVDAPGRLSERMRRDFAVIVPAYNEVENVPELVGELRATFERHGLAGEVLLVDDGSTDGTADAARAAGRDWGALRVLHHRRNFGKTEAWIVLHGLGQLASVFECVNSHADLSVRRTAPWPPQIAAKIDERIAESAALDWPAPLCGVIAP